MHLYSEIWRHRTLPSYLDFFQPTGQVLELFLPQIQHSTVDGFLWLANVISAFKQLHASLSAVDVTVISADLVMETVGA